MVWYGIASLRRGAEIRPALVLEDRFVDVETSAAVLGVESSQTLGSVDNMLSQWPNVVPALNALAEAATNNAERLESLDPGPLDVLPPFRPERLFCAAANYAEHASEMGTKLADKSERRPYMFMKPGTAVVGHDATVVLPDASEMVDWEVELAAVIGRDARAVSIEDALDYVAGYTIVNDVTARDLNERDDYPFKTDWLWGKCFDTFAPLGPWLVPSDCIADPHDLRMQLLVNDATMQDSSTAAMIYDIREQIAYLTSILTLQPGDVIATGTPTGVGMGRGIFLKPGDVMTATIESIGSLRNPVAADTD